MLTHLGRFFHPSVPWDTSQLLKNSCFGGQTENRTPQSNIPFWAVCISPCLSLFLVASPWSYKHPWSSSWQAQEQSRRLRWWQNIFTYSGQWPERLCLGSWMWSVGFVCHTWSPRSLSQCVLVSTHRGRHPLAWESQHLHVELKSPFLGMQVTIEGRPGCTCIPTWYSRLDNMKCTRVGGTAVESVLGLSLSSHASVQRDTYQSASG